MHAADGKDRDEHRRETLQVPVWNAMDELPSTFLTPGLTPAEQSRSQLLSSVKKRSGKTPKRVIAKADSGPYIDAKSPDLLQDEGFLTDLYSSPLDFGAKEFHLFYKNKNL